MKEGICKEDLLEELHQAIRSRISEASRILDEVQESVDSESQSTAGDKHDTSRELMQQERNKAAQNLQNQMAMDGLFITLKNTSHSKVITFGSLVHRYSGNSHHTRIFGIMRMRHQHYGPNRKVVWLVRTQCDF